MPTQRPQHITVVFGTRPEALKLAPVLRALKSRGLDTLAVSTGQHREMLDQALVQTGLQPDIDLNVMQDGQSLNGLLSRLLAGLGRVFSEGPPSLVVVQGDTTSSLAGALAAHHLRVPVAHVEAGLRTGDPANPFPEESNRRLISTLATIHFPPTSRARRALVDEKHPLESILVTGNTAVDAVLEMKPVEAPLLDTIEQGRLLLVTTHRRESFDGGLKRIFSGLLELVGLHPDLVVVFPVHLNPNVRKPAHEILGDHPRIHLLEPIPHDKFVALMRRATLLLTDSGGVQEEAPSLNKPVLLLREVTERPEALDAGAAVLVGTDQQKLVSQAHRLLSDDDAYQAMASIPSPFGDGRAASRIALAIERWTAGELPLLKPEEQFRPSPDRESPDRESRVLFEDEL